MCLWCPEIHLGVPEFQPIGRQLNTSEMARDGRANARLEEVTKATGLAPRA